MHGLLELLVLAAVLLGVTTWGMLHLGWAAGHVHQCCDDNTSRHVTCTPARLLLYAPLWLPLLLLAAAFLPGLIGSIWDGVDHCLTHGTNHHHLCLVHPPHLAHQATVWVVAPFILLMTPGMLRHGRRLVAQWYTTRALLGWSRTPHELGDDIQVVTLDEPLACVAGWFSSTIILSTGFLERCHPTTLEVVLAHERAHIARRDTFWSTLDRAMALICLSPLSTYLLRHLTLAQEQACDQSAARAVGSPIAVAQALVEVASLSMAVPQGSHSITSSVLETRVHSLLDSTSTRTHAPSQRMGRILKYVGGFGVLLWVGASPCHAALEWCAAHLLHP